MIRIILGILLLACFLTGCGMQTTAATVEAQETPVQTAEPTAQQFEAESMTETTQEWESEQAETAEETDPVMKLKINDTVLEVLWEDNESVEALFALVRAEPLTISMSMYGGFEQVGAIGSSLPRNDVQTTTHAGDLVLYSGSQIVVFYGSNSWAYTRLGRIQGLSAGELESLLGNGAVTLTLYTED